MESGKQLLRIVVAAKLARRLNTAHFRMRAIDCFSVRLLADRPSFLAALPSKQPDCLPPVYSKSNLYATRHPMMKANRRNVQLVVKKKIER